MYNETVNQFFEDGVQIELSTGYQHVSVDNIIGLYLTGKTVGILNEFPIDYVKRLEYDIYMMTPSGFMPGPLNDGWDVHVPNYINSYTGYFPNSTLIRWFFTEKTKSSAVGFDWLWKCKYSSAHL